MWIEWTIATKFLREGKAQSVLILVGIAVGVAVCWEWRDVMVPPVSHRVDLRPNLFARPPAEAVAR